MGEAAKRRGRSPGGMGGRVASGWDREGGAPPFGAFCNSLSFCNAQKISNRFKMVIIIKLIYLVRITVKAVIGHFVIFVGC